MRTSAFLATLVVALLVAVTLSAPVSAQNAGANAPQFKIAVVDISYIFKNHQRFKATMDGMKGQVQNAEGSLRTERQAIARKEEQLKTFNPGTPEYKQLEEQIMKEKGEFNLKAAKQRKEFLEKEAKIYYQTYLEVNDAVKYYAQQRQIGLVLRFNGDPVDPNRREDVLRAINKPVVYQNSIDITPDILRTVNRSGMTAPKGPINPAQNIPGRPATGLRR